MPELSRPALRPSRTPVVDSARWDRFEPRADDIIIATYPKCGTTWTQRIVDMLIFQSTEPRNVDAASPWLDSRLFDPLDEQLAVLEAQKHRRLVKSHLPLYGLPIYEGVKYIHVARDGRDACMSFHNHMMALSAAAMQRVFANVAADGMTGPPPDPPAHDLREYYLQWIAEAEGEASGMNGGSFFDYENSYWAERARANLLLVHYNDLKADLPGEVARISRYLDIDTPAALLADIAAAASFEVMKRQGDAIMGDLTQTFDGGSQRFLHKGVNGRWRDVLTAGDVTRFDALVRRKFSPACAAWIEGGRLVAGDPRTAPD